MNDNRSRQAGSRAREARYELAVALLEHKTRETEYLKQAIRLLAAQPNAHPGVAHISDYVLRHSVAETVDPDRPAQCWRFQARASDISSQAPKLSTSPI